ncbi:uncharacterized protein BO95DRAFT_436291 [Aspergillus brunneoviolaceus CBS 621.78]|uniref:Uncharacterized protein n=1 Tax=Aspergillus brunneoviolaceus CBS 621.78 TaxID=1450534 RepID=A0ACD1FV82_9EURO|nr:hypothetical protein BO95DRAFT_436291 [Aspergillus brunneoviolaceus CBS 621.78]RAH40882.1 hypothetical protein BO95DRAFT_436291 [Aspergillus brunneoviolaceus CBS 621.78]
MGVQLRRLVGPLQGLYCARGRTNSPDIEPLRSTSLERLRDREKKRSKREKEKIGHFQHAKQRRGGGGVGGEEEEEDDDDDDDGDDDDDDDDDYEKRNEGKGKDAGQLHQDTMKHWSCN